MKVTVRQEPYTITDGNGGVLQAKVIEKPTPTRIRYVTRKSNRGRFKKTPFESSVQAFRKLLVEQTEA